VAVGLGERAKKKCVRSKLAGAPKIQRSRLPLIMSISNLRHGIAIDLERELGRKPSDDEVVQRYEDIVLSQ
jgi:hypothetical protein